MEAGHVRGDHIILPKVDSKGKRYNRVIWLTPVAESIVRRLLEGVEGRLFRNKWGKPWTRGRLNERRQESSKKLGFRFFFPGTGSQTAIGPLTSFSGRPSLANFTCRGCQIPFSGAKNRPSVCFRGSYLPSRRAVFHRKPSCRLGSQTSRVGACDGAAPA
jgi:hypothetical protein